MAELEVHRAGRASVLYDAERLGRYESVWFDVAHWQRHGARLHSSTGRGGVLMLERGSETWVLRHYHRGGLVAAFVYDHYLWLGARQSRSFREWHLLGALHAQKLPVPEPLAARVERYGPFYRADLITRYLPDTRTLSAYLADGGPEPARWPAIGRMLRRFHDHGVDHPDLTAHNILLDTSGGVFLVDFDNARSRAPGAWSERGLARLQRSLRKVALEQGDDFDGGAWAELEAGYRG